MATEPCPVERCPRNKSTAYLMCRPHWSRVSPTTRDRVYATFRAYSAAAKRGDEPEAFRAARVAYTEARDDALAEASR